jgi:hypothetical protein
LQLHEADGLLGAFFEHLDLDNFHAFALLKFVFILFVMASMSASVKPDSHHQAAVACVVNVASTAAVVSSFFIFSLG